MLYVSRIQWDTLVEAPSSYIALRSVQTLLHMTLLHLTVPLIFLHLIRTIHNFCTMTEDPTSSSITTPLNNFEALHINIGGSELYYLFKNHIESFLESLVKKCGEDVGEDGILGFYVEKWQAFTRSCITLHNMFNYLNRMWIKRKLDEQNTGVYDINTVCFQIHEFKI